MLKRFLTDIPTPATPQNPLLRYELTRHSPLLSPGARVLRVSGWVIGLVLLVLSGYTIATDFMRQPAGLNLTESIWRTLFFPALFLQIMLRIMALSLGVSAISEERQKQRWASLRATENGASLALQTRIVAIFYRLRGLLLPILAVRVVLTGALLYELTSMRGDYLAILAGSSTPSVPLLIAVLLLAALMTAGLLMPLTATGVEAALGLLISAAIRNRALAGLLQVLLIVFQMALTAGLAIGMLRFLDGAFTLSEGLAGLWLMAYSVVADWSLVLLQLQQAGAIWARVPLSVFLGGGLLLVVALQMLLIQGLLRLAIRAAERAA